MCERKMVFWKAVVLMLSAGAIRLAEFIVVEHFADAGDMAQDAVDDFAPRLILVEAERDVIA